MQFIKKTLAHFTDIMLVAILIVLILILQKIPPAQHFLTANEAANAKINPRDLPAVYIKNSSLTIDGTVDVEKIQDRVDVKIDDSLF